MADSQASAWTAEPYSVAAARSIAHELALHPATASILVRRGYDTPELARRFLAAGERHDPGGLPGAAAAVEAILRHVERGSRIVIHGDYDVDGVCATAVLARAIRRVGAEAVCQLPSRFDEGYGLSKAGVEQLAATGTDLLVTVDCGITAVAEVARATELGLEVVVSDHHRPGDELPACTIVHPALGGYGCPELCAAGVAHKLAAALSAAAGRDPLEAEEDIDLAALATVCDVVPLVGENRRIVREGVAALRRTRKPGLRALMAVASCDPGALDAGSCGFRLGPRINAAGRMRRPDAALELLMTDDAVRAGEVAGELDLLNRERQDTETRIGFAAEAELGRFAHEPAYVLAGEGWHPGVIGIVASRLVERHHRPCILIALDGEGSGRGSGRSIAAFDLHAGLGACSRHLGRFGGHRMAAGFDIAADAVDDFRRAFVRHAAGVLTPGDLRPLERVDAVVDTRALGLPLAEELERLGPFGHCNPRPTLLVPAVRVEEPRAMGEERQHARFTLSGSGGRARGVAFRRTAASLRDAGDAPADAVVRLERNEWNGTVEPRVVLRALCESGGGRPELVEEPLWDAIAREREADPKEWGAATPDGARRGVEDRRGGGVAALLVDLVASGERVAVVCADARRRAPALARITSGPVAVVSWDCLAARPALASSYGHLVTLDPPPGPQGIQLLRSLEQGVPYLAWGGGESAYALAAYGHALRLRTQLAELYRRLRDAGPEDVEAILRGPGALRGSGVCARLVRVLEELGLARCSPAERRLELTAGTARTELERSTAFRAYAGRADAVEAWLGEQAPPSAPTLAA